MINLPVSLLKIIYLVFLLLPFVLPLRAQEFDCDSLLKDTTSIEMPLENLLELRERMENILKCQGTPEEDLEIILSETFILASFLVKYPGALNSNYQLGQALANLMALPETQSMIKSIRISEQVARMNHSPENWLLAKKLLSEIAPPEALIEMESHINTRDFEGLSYRTIFATLNSEESEKTNGEKASIFKEFISLDEALAQAKAESKTLLIYFSGYGSVNCRKLEEEVFSDRNIRERLESHFLSFIIMVDDRTPLSENEQYTSSYSSKKVETQGQRNQDLQWKVAQSNRQPLIVLLDERAQMIASKSYDLDIQAWLRFLQELE